MYKLFIYIVICWVFTVEVVSLNVKEEDQVLLNAFGTIDDCREHNTISKSYRNV